MVGYLAAGLVLVAFGMKEMVPLRIVALCSNLAFIAYGIGLDLTPIWLLHASLLPLNGWRLGQALRSSAGTGRTRTRGHTGRRATLGACDRPGRNQDRPIAATRRL